MSEERWNAVERYFDATLVQAPASLDAALAATAAAGLPPINVAPNQGKLLHLLARAIAARTMLEIGTLGGYSTIWLARALPPDGHLISLEVDPRNAALARENLVNAGVAGRVAIREGKALDTLPELAAADAGPFDLVFIDADKPNNAAYFDWALRLSRPGTVIVIDNVVRDGKVIDADSTDKQVQGVRQVLERIANEPRVSATAIQTVGSKGYDGLALAVVLPTM
ncbi:MAG: O-methyltransferase [Thermomicrobiales bacterium]